MKCLEISQTWPAVHLRGWSELNDILIRASSNVELSQQSRIFSRCVMLYHVSLLLLWLSCAVVCFNCARQCRCQSVIVMHSCCDDALMHCSPAFVHFWCIRNSANCIIMQFIIVPQAVSHLALQKSLVCNYPTRKMHDFFTQSKLLMFLLFWHSVNVSALCGLWRVRTVRVRSDCQAKVECYSFLAWL